MTNETKRKHTPTGVIAKQVRCPDGYGARSLRIIRAAKARGMHLLANGKVMLPSGKVATSTPQDGRHRINLSVDGDKISVQTARVVCFLAHGEPPTTTSVADHVDGNTLNDAPSNLRWASYSENTRNTEFTRNPTREQRCVLACEGINPEAVPDLLEACKEMLAAMPRDGRGAAGRAVAMADAALTKAGAR